jgi:hypothetical protein
MGLVIEAAHVPLRADEHGVLLSPGSASRSIQRCIILIRARRAEEMVMNYPTLRLDDVIQ